MIINDYHNSTSSGQPRMICLHLERPVTLEGISQITSKNSIEYRNQDHPSLSIETRNRTSLNRGVGYGGFGRLQTFAALDLTYSYGSCKAFNSMQWYGRRTCRSNTEVKLYYINCDDKRASFNKSHEGKLSTKLTMWRSLSWQIINYLLWHNRFFPWSERAFNNKFYR